MKRSRDPESESKETSEPARHTQLSSLSRAVSPPRRRSRIDDSSKSTSRGIITSASNDEDDEDRSSPGPTGSISSLAAVESGQTAIADHVSFISTRLRQCARPVQPSEARISFSDWTDLYERNQLDENGTHFVIHQHDHPIAGTHYDLRLQFSRTSSVSWSVVYGMPGDPNSSRMNRNAIETRVHCLWVSSATLLISCVCLHWRFILHCRTISLRPLRFGLAV